jgi:hypothetical protein
MPYVSVDHLRTLLVMSLHELATGQHGWFYRMVALGFLASVFGITVCLAHGVVWFVDQMLTRKMD